MGQAIGQIANAISALLKFHKLKVVFVLFLATLLAVLLFPSEDLSDLVSGQITKATGTYTQFDRVGLNFVPSPGVSAEKIVIEAGIMPPIKADELHLAVSPLHALTGRVGVSADARGLFSGDIAVGLEEGDKLKSGERVKNIDIEATKINLAALSDYLQRGDLLPIAMHGALSMKSNIALDVLFNEQPKGTIGVDIGNFRLPPQTVNTMMGPLPTPALQLGKVNLKANMNQGNLDIQEMSFGGPKDDLAGKVRGQMGLAFRRSHMGVAPVVDTYNLVVDLTVQKTFLEANSKSGLSLIFDFVKDYKRETPDGVRYVFRMQPDPSGMPKFSAAQ